MILRVSSLDYQQREDLDDDDKKIIHSAIQDGICQRESTSSTIGYQTPQARWREIPTARIRSDRELGDILNDYNSGINTLEQYQQRMHRWLQATGIVSPERSRVERTRLDSERLTSNGLGTIRQQSAGPSPAQRTLGEWDRDMYDGR